MFRTSNPAMNNSAFAPAQTWVGSINPAATHEPGMREARAAVARSSTMSLQGTVNKSALLIAICAVLAIVAWRMSFDASGQLTSLGYASMFGGMIGGLILCLTTCIKPKWSPITAPIYAAFEGLFVGGISAMYAAYVPTSGADAEGVRSMLNTGLIFNAGLLTFGIFGGLLAAYSFKLIRPNRLFYNITLVGTLGVCAYGLIAFIASRFGAPSLASVYDPNNGGLISIGFSLLVVGLASMNLVLDFDLANNGIRNRAPKYFEWYAGFALLVTLVWLYVNLLQLLAKLQSRD
ncbi:MAG: Bax inhibitor-1/YccA family protein [Phycisphaerales bacterium]|nr:Bax inhibitor-1/YccA family protein [Phycisphaerales bacterium]